ncbi:magnesium transporter CorA family protein [Lachnoanaerobaculum sp. Marseille-Q4761]|jgi:magnesium transporter corA|uniref:magnesium transporter CorA family protein n=1 Tax=Lachnoanaerobaculum sp. Marseille-Q4761 TaxID=2819511 RepID=UPI001AA12759|nr:magnesium transporter CorA family protein [Lachnoanaerobaculum sp. Marseille-Q4761]MBO1870547.1 magnesium transporter CorA family protein [Lachnoanaerobaculum sp. Marseille-Q4761]
MQMYLGEEGKKYYWRVEDVSNIADVETLETKFDLTEEMAEYVLDSNERARVEYDGKNLLVVIHVPAFTQNNGHYETRSIKFFVNSESVFMFVTYDTNYIVPQIEKYIKAEEASSPMMLLFLSLFVISDSFMPILDKLNEERLHLNRRLRINTNNQGIWDLSDLEVGLIYLGAATRQNVVAIRQMRITSAIKKCNEAEKEELEDAYIEAKQASDMADMSASIVEQMSGMYNNLINIKLNETMRIMTIWSLLMTIPTVISGFFGMNVDLPFAKMEGGWILISVITAVLLWVMWKFIWKKL